MFDFNLMYLIAGLPGLIIALVIHEYAHARVAVAMGDFTPKLTGRLTLNPMAHIDVFGFIMLLFVRFGWAKPVMINPRNFKDMRKGNVLVALAGPVSNLIVAFLTMFVMMLLVNTTGKLSTGANAVLTMIVLYNVNFAIFNLIPLPPLDGSKIVLEFLPYRYAYKYMAIERYSMFIFIAMMMTPILGSILSPLSNFTLNSFYSIITLLL